MATSRLREGREPLADGFRDRGEKAGGSRAETGGQAWGRFFESLGSDFESGAAAKQSRAERRMALVTDPRTVPMIWKHFVRMSERRELAAVQMLGQIDGPSPAMGLAAMAVFSPRPEVRLQATDTVGRYDPRDIVEPLIDVLQKPFAYQVRSIGGPGSDGELFVEGERFNVQRIYQDQSGAAVLWAHASLQRRFVRSVRGPEPAGGCAGQRSAGRERRAGHDARYGHAFSNDEGPRDRPGASAEARA